MFFSFVDLCFIINCPEDNSLATTHDSGGLDLFSFVANSVGLYIHSSLVNLFTLVRHDAGGACISFCNRGKIIVLGGVM